MAPYVACEVAKNKARSNAQFEAQPFRRGFRTKNKSAVEYEEACSSDDFDR